MVSTRGPILPMSTFLNVKGNDDQRLNPALRVKGQFLFLKVLTHVINF